MGKYNAEESYAMISPKVNSVRHINKFYGAMLLAIFLIIGILIVLHYLYMQPSQDDGSKTSSPVQEIILDVLDDIRENVVHNPNSEQEVEDQTRRPSWRIPPSQIDVLGKHHQHRSPYISLGRSNLSVNQPLQRPNVKLPGQHKDRNRDLLTNEYDEELQHLLIFMVQMAGVFLVVSVGIYFACKMERDVSKLGKWSRSNPNMYQKAHCAACSKI